MKKKRLVCHHIIPIADGGPDTLENTATLCSDCHRDWHFLCEDHIDFETFLDTVPSLNAQMWFIMDSPEIDKMTIGAVKALNEAQRFMNFGFEQGEDGAFSYCASTRRIERDDRP